MRHATSYDVFCRVVDNFGDAAVCWRLARELSLEHHAQVRLWIDDPAILVRLVPAAREGETLDGVLMRRWNATPVDAFETLPDVMIEAFGCGVPAAYVEAMVRAPQPPLWIVLEYLSAEPWVSSHHGLPSPHPKYPLERFFFFPGFSRDTGGLLREADFFVRRGRFGRAERDAFWNDAGHVVPGATATTVSLFAYENAPLIEMLECWARGDQQIVAAIPEGPLLARAQEHFGGAHGDRVIARGAVEVRGLPFLTQKQYDELLWSCDLNFVRGEDSFVRAQWAARPLVWHTYAQHENAHDVKLESFLALYCEALDPQAGLALTRLMQSWNQTQTAGVTVAAAWADLMAHRVAVERHARQWAARLAKQPELAQNLAQFCRGKLK